jgi:hypothetical protein
MKKQLVVALGLAVLATPAFASKARLQALGDDVNGSFYINDNRNVFLNAANINNHKDLVTFEWGDTGTAVDGTAAPRSEGGVFKTAGNMVYGVYLGSESNTSNAFRTLGAGVAMEEENNIDLFVGGDAGMKWGANLTYSKSNDDETAGTEDTSQQAIRTRLGVIAGDIEGYANINISNKAEDATGDEFDGNLGYQIGAIYNLNEYRIFADYSSFSGDADSGTTTDDGEISTSKLQVGAGRATKLNDKATLYTKANLLWVKGENDYDTTNTGFAGGCSGTAVFLCEEYKGTSIPVVIGLEYDAASWLALRTSIGQTIWGKQEDADDKKGFQETTVVNAGATLKFGELSVDGVIGNSLSGANAGGDNTATGNGNLRTDNLMSRVSMTYRF